MKTRILSLLLISVLLLSALLTAAVIPAAAESAEMTPMYGEQFRPDGVTFGRVSFTVPGGTQGLTKDAWDGNIDHNTDLILLSYVKDGELYANKTIREIKAHLGNLALVRTCYTYDDQPDGTIRVSRLTYEATSEAAEAYARRAEKADPEERRTAPRRRHRRSRLPSAE